MTWNTYITSIFASCASEWLVKIWDENSRYVLKYVKTVVLSNDIIADLSLIKPLILMIFLFFLFQEYLFSFLILNHKLEILHGHRTQVPSLLVLQLMGRHIFLIFTWTSILQSVVNKLCLEGHMGSWIISRLALVLRYWLLAIISKCKAIQDILLRVYYLWFLFSNFNLNIFNDFEH